VTQHRYWQVGQVCSVSSWHHTFLKVICGSVSILVPWIFFKTKVLFFPESNDNVLPSEIITSIYDESQVVHSRIMASTVGGFPDDTWPRNRHVSDPRSQMHGDSGERSVKPKNEKLYLRDRWIHLDVCILHSTAAELQYEGEKKRTYRKETFSFWMPRSVSAQQVLSHMTVDTVLRRGTVSTTWRAAGSCKLRALRGCCEHYEGPQEVFLIMSPPQELCSQIAANCWTN
jgi:hypothetical protein